MFNLKSFGQSIKPLLGILFIAILAFVFFVVSAFNDAVEVELEKAHAFSDRVSYEMQTRVEHYVSRLNTMNNNIEKVCEVYGEDEFSNKLFNYYVADQEILNVYLLRDNEIVSSFNIHGKEVATEMTYRSAPKDYDGFKYNFLFGNTEASSVIITVPIEYDKYDEIALEIDVEYLAQNFYESDVYELSIIVNNEMILYSDDIEIVNSLIENYGSEVFKDYEHYSRGRDGFRVNDFNYLDYHIIHYQEVFDNLHILTTKTYNKISYSNVEDNIMSHLIVFSMMVISAIGTILYSSQKTKTWIENDRQFLNEIIDMDKIQITELKREIKFYTDMFNETPEPLLLIDKETLRIMNANEAARKYYEYTLDELSTMFLHNICKWQDDDVSDNKLFIQHIKKSGQIEEKYIRVQEVLYNETEMLSILLLDNAPISNSDDLKLEMFHEIRSPLQGAFGAVEMIEKATSKYGDYTNIIKRSLSNVLMMTNNVLAKGKLESSYEKVLSEKFNLVNLVNDVVNTIVFQDKNYNLIAGQVQENIQDVLRQLDSYYIKSDHMKIRQILINLMSNSVKYTKDGMVNLSVEVHHDFKDVIIFRVSDTGSGLSKEAINQMYEQFKTFHNVSTTSTGIGLAITKKYVEMLGSELHVSSEEGIGTTFSFSLELDPVHLEADNDISNKSILVLDDDEVSCEFLKKLLQKEVQCFVKTISNESHLISELSHHEYDCLIIDQTLNHFKGVDLIKLLRNSYNQQIKEIPVVLITASKTKHEFRELTGARIDEIILKPFESSEVVEVLKEIFNNQSKKENKLINLINDDIIDKTILCETIDSVGDTIFKELVEKFKINSTKEIQLVTSLLSSGNYSAIKSILHRLKGSMSYFAPIKLTLLVQQLEILALNEDDDFNDIFIEFKSSHEELLKELNNLVQNL